MKSNFMKNKKIYFQKFSRLMQNFVSNFFKLKN